MGSQCSRKVEPHIFMMDWASGECEPLSNNKSHGVVILMGTEDGGRGYVLSVTPPTLYPA